MRAHLDIAHEGTLDDGSRVKMQIDSNSTAFLMSILTDLYSDPELAVIREYSTNALDSHRAARCTDPIEIELPSSLRPLFVVRDHGVGMSVDDVVHHFSKYGWSSKRDNDDEVGMLGLGCKSGLTYTSQFTLIAIKNGVRATVLVTREVDGAGAIQVIDTMSTYEPNGVEVQIPVKSSPTFNDKAKQFFSFWIPGSVLVNGNAPHHVRDEEDVLVLDPDVILAKNLDHDYVVMGNVAYPIERPLYPGTRWRMVAWVPIGAVDFTPSREALHLTNRTEETVTQAHAFVESSLYRKAQMDIDSAPNHWYALQKAQTWREITRTSVILRGNRGNKVQVNPWYYRGEKVPSVPIGIDSDCALRWHGPDTSAPSERPSSLSLEMVEGSVFLVGHNGHRLARSDKQRLVMWMGEQNLSRYTPVIALPRLPASPWLDAGARTIHLDDLRGYKVETAPRKVGLSARGHYRVLNARGDVMEVGQLDTHVVWLPADAKGVRSTIMRFLSRMPDVSVVPVPRSQVARFLKENPAAQDYRTFIETMVYLFATSVTPGDLARITVGSEMDRSSLRALWDFRNQITDPEVVELVELCGSTHEGVTPVDHWFSLADVCRHLDIPLPVFGKDAKLVQRLNDVMTRYPLLQHLNVWHSSPKANRPFVHYINLLHFSES